MLLNLWFQRQGVVLRDKNSTRYRLSIKAKVRKVASEVCCMPAVCASAPWGFLWLELTFYYRIINTEVNSVQSVWADMLQSSILFIKCDRIIFQTSCLSVCYRAVSDIVNKRMFYYCENLTMNLNNPTSTFLLQQLYSCVQRECHSKEMEWNSDPEKGRQG